MKAFRKNQRMSVRRHQAGQAAVESLFMIPILIFVFMGMFELFTITFGAQNAHIRSREYVLHSGAFLQGAPAGEVIGGTVFDKAKGNYRIADPAMWGVAGAINGSANAKGFTAYAHDRGVAGISMGSGSAQFGGRQGVYLRSNAYICSPIGCPDTLP